MRETAKQFASAFAPSAPATATKPDTAFAEISSDVSYLPDLTAYLDDLLRTRERLAAAIDGVDEWARADATPPRRKSPGSGGDIAHLPAAGRAQVDQAVTVIRKHRAVNFGMPAVPPSPAAQALP